MRNLHKYEELFPWEFEKEKEKASIIYLAAGPVEFHEECNALGIDPLKGYEWCLKSAEITGGIVFPLLPIAPAGVPPYRKREGIDSITKGIRMGVFTDRDVCYALYKDLLDDFVRQGFKMCVFFGSHGPAGAMIKEIVKRENGESAEGSSSYKKIAGIYKGMHVMAVGSLDYNMDIVQEEYEKKKIERISHGGMWEAAINYAINREFFDYSLLDPAKVPQKSGALTEEMYEGCIRPVLSEYRKMSEEFADKLFRITYERLAEDVKAKYAAIAEGEKKG